MILASRSPRRRELLSSCGVEFSIFDADVDELSPGMGVALADLPQHNAALKARKVADLFPQEIVLAADTMVICGAGALGKPASDADAVEMLQMLSGKSHDVVTGVALIWHEKGICELWSETTRVCFKELTPETIREYMRLVDVSDKAGAYAIQEHGDLIVASWHGELENVIGLPLVKLQKRLKELIQDYGKDLFE